MWEHFLAGKHPIDKVPLAGPGQKCQIHCGILYRAKLPLPDTEPDNLRLAEEYQEMQLAT